MKKVGRGGFGLVESADWKSCGIKIALKTLIDNSSVDENSMNEFVKELKNLKKVSFHPNIITFFGISKEPLSEKYAIVLDFANQGNLREYLAIHFDNLKWSDKIQMALDIVCGLKCLHSKHIIHRDLHAKNILVNNNKLMIADFGASKQLSEATSNSTNSTADGIGIIEYMEPQLLEQQSDSQSSFNGIDSNQSKLMISRSSDDIIEAAGNEEFRNLLIVGYASSGKSTLSNVLCATDEFEKSECSARNIINFQKNNFEWNGTKYRLIDIGFSSIEKILYNKTEIFQLMPEGISRVLFVADGRFKEKEIETFEFFKKTIFESEIIGYTTIVRTKFCNFKNKNKCREDKKQMCEESRTIAKMVGSCSIIHVDNPPTNIIVNDDDDQERINHNRKIRERSRILLLNHLEIVCQNKYYEYNKVFAYCQSVIDRIPHLEEKKEKEIKRISTPIPDELEEKKIRNLLVVGYAGSGKSTLTNVLNDTGHLEGNKQIRKTKNFQRRVFKRNEAEYRVVDTIGIGDINLTKKKVICEKIAEVIYLIPEGISQVLVVIDGKCSAEKASTFNLLKDFIFESGIAKYITIVRTKFSNFRNEDECIKDKENLCDENEPIAKLCKSIVYVDNPPVDISVRDNDDKETIRINKRSRNQSREILLDHLDKVCGKKYYKLKIWDNLHNKTSVRNIAEEVERNLNSEIPSLYHFEEAESYSKPVQDDLPSPRIDDTTSSKKRNEKNYTPKLMKRLTSFLNLNSALFKLNPNKLEREKIGNLLIIGRTCSGKTALSDVLCGSNTVKKNFQQKSFEWKGTEYRLIEIRIKLIEKNSLFNKIGEIIYSMPEGISQVLFVVDRRFTAEEIETFKVFGKVILESGIIEHTTIIRTKFANFEKKSECERDKEELCRENEIISKMVGSCRGVIYVDNPPTNIQDVERREKPRTILLHHLKTACQGFYKLGTWDVLYDKITSYMKESEITSTVKDRIAKEVEFNLISDIPALHNVNFDAYRKYRVEIASRKILKDITSIHLGENIESPSDSHLNNSTSYVNFLKKTKLSTIESNKKVIRRFKLDHGLFLNEFTIQPGNQPIFTEDGELNIRLYNGQPIVYININDSSSTNLLDFDNKLQSFDVCINFLIAEITYKSEFLEEFSKCNDNEENFHESYGRFFARKVSVGNKLFIKEFNSATQTQIGILKFYLLCVYNLAKYSIEIQFKNLFTLDLLPKMETSDGEELNTYEKLIKWMNNLYPQKTSDKKKLNTHEELITWINKLCQDNKIDIISYCNFVTTSELRCSILPIYYPETFDEKQPGVINFKEKLSLEDWVRDVEYDNLISLITDSHLFQGLIFNQSCEMKVSEKIAINLLEVPKVNVRDKSCLEIIRPSTKLEVNLISNNIFSIKNLNTFPFIENDKEIYEDYNHVLFKCERYEILLNKNNIKPTETFEKGIEKALNSMRPLKSLQDIFNKYGHLFPQRIILGSSLKIILQNSSSSDAFDNINFKSPIFDSLKSYLDKLNISYLLTQKGKSIENQDLDNWIKDANDNLEIIEFDNIIPLYKILKKEQQSKIKDLLKSNYKILMTGVTNLRDLNNNNIEYYKRINIKPSLEDENYEVIGSIISENNTKLEEININFGLYDYNGFFAVIKKLEATNIDITRCYILWMIIGIPSKSSVFSPKNRKIQVNYIKESITLQQNQSCYPIKVPFLLSEGDVISVHAYYPLTNLEPNSIIIKLIKWNDRSIDVQITDIVSMSDIELHICVLHSYYGKLKIDNEVELEYPLNLIGCILTDDENTSDVN
ncbi:unnamed protein product [Rhizophagus irregularis]|uniref:Protein kinase domain-containing protein n=1 Tax=Rhizophagus irregularis TaxID=588596 RepID=A0A916EC36_9GLOM|nr:unnamed protein product [Rhizophagus irregularis]